MARTNGRSSVLGLIVVIVGVVFAVAGVVTWIVVQDQLAAEQIVVSDDATMLAGEQVDGPFSAYAQAQVINKHALEATGGQTYAQLGREDPARQTAMQASFLRASLFTSVVAFGVAVMAFALGITLMLIGMALRSLARTATERTGATAAPAP